ncbi:hypothetical protein EXS57_02105 [Candidatus Kaiserbacteria bacterium]|nr:hypothetical protein [Candidatus Kaiserbacteria bacterium]
MKKMILGRIAILAMMVLLGACASPGKLESIPFTGEGGQKWNYLISDQWGPDFIQDEKKRTVNVLVKGEVTQAQLDAIATTQGVCRIAESKRPGKWVAAISNGVLYLATGTLGAGFAIRALMPGVRVAQNVQYVSQVGAVSGATGGFINTATGESYLFYLCNHNLIAAAFPTAKITVMPR